MNSEVSSSKVPVSTIRLVKIPWKINAPPGVRNFGWMVAATWKKMPSRAIA